MGVTLAKTAKEVPNPEVLFLEAQPRLTFGVKAAAYGCGISVRQLDWWTRVGYVPVLQSGRHRRYSANAVKIALVINACINQGMSLRRAAELARQTYPSLWEDQGSLPEMENNSHSPSDELESVRVEVNRLTSELTEIGKRLDGLLHPSENGKQQKSNIEEEDLDDK
ncbi:MAG: MerR family transcriptional regulator [Armatimonadetes bacterium]|nr:MerR family transcriptional regulator [Armatimonadota bacterium]